MILEELQIQPFVLKLRTPVENARSTFRERRGLLLRLVDEQRRCGFGEVTPLTEFGTEDLAAASSAIQSVEPLLCHRDLPANQEEVRRLIADLDPLRTAPAARFGVELALLDLAAQRAGLPLAKFLSVSARQTVEVNALIVSKDPQALADEAEAAVTAGYPAVKVKVANRPLSEDAKRLMAVRRRVGEGTKIRIDANGMWSEAEAATALRGLAPLKLELCEQPVAAANYPALRRLRWLVPCPIAADESLAQPDALRAILDGEDGRVVDAVALKPIALGGVLTALEVARRADQLGLGCYVTSALDGVVARLGETHLAAALPRNGLACGLGTDPLCESDLGSNPCTPERGTIRLLERPGLGLDPDWGRTTPSLPL